jgi:hypothetical protein
MKLEKVGNQCINRFDNNNNTEQIFSQTIDAKFASSQTTKLNLNCFLLLLMWKFLKFS